MREKVLVTGGAGYIGSVLVRQLLDAGYAVRVLDNLSFGGESLIGILQHPHFEFQKGDLREAGAVAKAVRGIDAVVHLAAIVGDPAGKAQPELTRAVNWEASKALHAQCRAAGVRRFVFASTCSNYGVMAGQTEPVDEDAALRPQSLYAQTKVDFEQYLLAQNGAGPAATILRFATVYGHSHRVRFDLSVNHFTRDLALGKSLEIFGKEQWRPYCHVQDLCRSVVLVLENDAEKMRGKVFNVGDSEENYTKIRLVDELKKAIPDAQVSFRDTGNDDPRNYRVDFSRIKKDLGFAITLTVPDGIREILALVRSGLVADPFDKKYRNC